MPVLSWAHSKYWQAHAPEAPQTGASSAGGYVPWQTSVIVGSMFGGLQPVWQWVVTVIKKDSK